MAGNTKTKSAEKRFLMGFHEFSFFQMSVAILCRDGMDNISLRKRLSKLGLPNVDGDPRFYMKMARCLKQGILVMTKEAHGREPASYKTSRAAASEVEKAFGFLKRCKNK